MNHKYQYEDDLGRISLDGSSIRYESSTLDCWSISQSDIRVIAELTNDLGPDLADHFFTLVTEPSACCSFPCCAVGATDLLGTLEVSLGFKRSHSLAGCTDLASVIHWPLVLAGKPLFSYTPVERPLGERILRFWREDQIDIQLTDEVRQYIHRFSNTESQDD